MTLLTNERRHCGHWLKAVLGLILTIAASASVSAAARPIAFERLSLDDGLSQTNANVILQDSQGFLWIGTQDGLNRYDGNSFKVYKHDPSDLESLADDFVYDIAEDDSGDLWLATNRGGLVRWHRKEDRFERVRLRPDAAGLPQRTRTLLFDKRGRLWVGSSASGLTRLLPTVGRLTHYRHDPGDALSLSDDGVFSLLEDRYGDLWVGTNGGLDRIGAESGEIEHFLHDPRTTDSLSDNRVRAIFEDGDGTLWVGTYDGGLNRFDRSRETFVRFQHLPTSPTSLAHNEVRAILEDSRGRLWIGTGNGLDLLDRRAGSFSHYRHDPADPKSLSQNQIRSIYQDRSGVLWIGTMAGGLNKWHPRSWSFGHIRTTTGQAGGLSHNHVSSFSQDRKGTLYVGTLDGLDVLDRANGETRHLGPGDGSGLSDPRVMSLLHDRSGTLWIGTMRGGLNRLDPGRERVRVYRHDPERPSSLSANGVMTLYEDNLGALWIGTYGGGLDRFDRQTDGFVHHRHDPDNPASLSSNRVTSLVEDGSGSLWIGTDGGGLNLLDRRSGEVRHFRHHSSDPNGLTSDTIFSLHHDADGRLWVGTQGGGLLRLDEVPAPGQPASFKVYSERNGLANDDVFGILPAADGSLWISTNRGLSRLDPATESFRTYLASHGLQANEFNSGAAYRATSGELFFGGVNGLNAFFPSQIVRDSPPPPMALTGFLKLNRPVVGRISTEMLDHVELGYRDDVVAFEFAALDFTAPQENRYQYRLEGFDDEWIDLGSTRRATFTDLAGGDFVLRVRAANSDGVWNEEGLSLPIHVDAPPWRTPWAYLLYFLMAGFAIFGFARLANRKLQREEQYSRRLEHEVEERSAELTSKANELEELNEKLVEASLTDPLTGLANRRFLVDYVKRETSLVERQYGEFEKGIDRRDIFDLMFMMIDLDDFKSINDTCGHEAGDRVLIQVRDLLYEACRKSDLVVRWGGDEFLVVGRDSTPDGLETLAERIRSKIEEHAFDLGAGRFAHTTCSIGFACYPFAQTDVGTHSWEKVVNVADRALYAAKRTCRNSWVGLRINGEAKAGGRHEVIPEQPEGLLEVLTSIPEDVEIAWN